MRVIIQRVKESKVEINNQVHGAIDYGYVLLVGFTEGDNEVIAQKMAKKVVELRIFEDEQGKMNKSLKDVGGKILSISQFTLYANCTEGRRPSFVNAMRLEGASRLYDLFNQELSNLEVKVETGIFQSDMQVHILNDGPVTIILDSKELKY
jgi:D-tyrosyl-tRNA(Tyr) deacylase